MKKVLIISYYFPPSGGSGVQRTLKFVKYLQAFGWMPVVLTARDADYPAYDETLCAEIPGTVKVYRAPLFEPYRLYRKFTGRSAAAATDIATLTLDDRHKRSWPERISEFVRASFFIPDARIAWLYPACRLGKKIIEDENIRLIFSSAPPYTCHLIGRKLQHATGLPWVADFRDSWIGWLSTPQWRPRPARALEKRMEQGVLRDANRILTVSCGVKEDLLSRNPDCLDERWALLPNGYDAQDFIGLPVLPKRQGLTITYTGSLYGNRNPHYLLKALEFLQSQGNPHVDALRILLVGRVGEAILGEIADSKAGHLFEHIPYVKHRESLAYLQNSDASLLIIDDAPANRGILTGKIYEYIGAGHPIIALAPEGEAANLIRVNRLGWVAPPNDPLAIARVLDTALTQLKNNPQRGAAAAPERFERRAQTGLLAQLFDELTQDAS